VLGVFGLSGVTDNQRLQQKLQQYGSLKKVVLVYDKKTGESRRFGFATFEKQEDATAAKEACDAAGGLDIDNVHARVDYSLTHKPHTSTPGVYFGKRRAGFGNYRPRERR
jgi:transformer-2 protein